MFWSFCWWWPYQIQKHLASLSLYHTPSSVLVGFFMLYFSVNSATFTRLKGHYRLATTHYDKLPFSLNTKLILFSISFTILTNFIDCIQHFVHKIVDYFLPSLKYTRLYNIWVHLSMYECMQAHAFFYLPIHPDTHIHIHIMHTIFSF